MKKGNFVRTKVMQRAFVAIKDKLCLAYILDFLNFELLYIVECDVSGVSMRAVLSQAKWPLS